MKMNDYDKVIGIIEDSVEKVVLPSVSFIAEEGPAPFRILVSTMISLRTKDEVTLPASLRLFKKADNPADMLKLSAEEIEKLIYPAGFYKTKAKNILKASQILMDEYAGIVPSVRENLMALPGVGLKTANLVMSLGFNINAICVDTHVHRISNRLGWVKTKNPDETEKALSRVLPEKYWIPINELLIFFGQQICKPLSPFCSTCPLSDFCPRNNVEKFR
ncbi:MAG: endonuclease III [Spirochaetales bacterium]|nr:endonuclease III [Spirochaetales bacterium]